MIFGFQILGLLIDIFGAFFLAKAIIVKPSSDIEKESATYWGGNPYSLPAMFRQKLESLFGFIMLFFGFIFQAIGLKINLMFFGWFEFSTIIVSLIVISIVANLIINLKANLFIEEYKENRKKQKEEKETKRQIEEIKNSYKSLSEHSK